MEKTNPVIRVICSAVIAARVAIARMCGARVEWETQTTEPDGCWRTWSDGFPSLDAAMKSMHADIAAGKRWNQYMPDEAVRWRVQCSIVRDVYYAPNRTK